LFCLILAEAVCLSKSNGLSCFAHSVNSSKRYVQILADLSLALALLEELGYLAGLFFPVVRFGPVQMLALGAMASKFKF
jgi:hypothetical protein